MSKYEVCGTLPSFSVFRVWGFRVNRQHMYSSKQRWWLPETRRHRSAAVFQVRVMAVTAGIFHMPRTSQMPSGLFLCCQTVRLAHILSPAVFQTNVLNPESQEPDQPSFYWLGVNIPALLHSVCNISFYNSITMYKMKATSVCNETCRWERIIAQTDRALVVEE